MIKKRAPESHLPLSMALLLGCIAWCASALAASDIRIPCPDTLASGKTTLPAVLEKDATVPQLQRLEAATIVTLPPISADADDAPRALAAQGRGAPPAGHRAV